MLSSRKGVLIGSPRPTALHQRVLYRLQHQLDAQLPAEWEALGQLEVVVDDHDPGTVRVPDVVVVSANGDHKQLKAADVVLAVEVISPWSRRLPSTTWRARSIRRLQPSRADWWSPSRSRCGSTSRR